MTGLERVQRYLEPDSRGGRLGDVLATRVRLPSSWGMLADLTRERVLTYYQESQSYLIGPLQGTCHFGYTPEGEEFDLRRALHAMEMKLGEALDLPRGSHVVDAGCGYGRVAATIAREFGLNILGIDLIPERIEEAKRYLDEQGLLETVTLYEGDYTTIPVSDNSMDGVYTMETLCHADTLEAALREFMRILKPGGRVVFFEYSMPPYKSLGFMRKRITDTMIKKIGMASMGRFEHGALPEILRSAGFENVTADEISRYLYPTWQYLFRLALKENWASIGPSIMKGTLTDRPNTAGALFIYPYRHFLGYNIVTATKPSREDSSS